ncbi:unnamed protein product, partial [Protopolystoma xenopodis]
PTSFSFVTEETSPTAKTPTAPGFPNPTSLISLSEQNSFTSSGLVTVRPSIEEHLFAAPSSSTSIINGSPATAHNTTSRVSIHQHYQPLHSSPSSFNSSSASGEHLGRSGAYLSPTDFFANSSVLPTLEAVGHMPAVTLAMTGLDLSDAPTREPTNCTTAVDDFGYSGRASLA